MKPRLRVTTPVIRPENLKVMAGQREWEVGERLFELRWDVLVDCATLGREVYPHPMPGFAVVRNIWHARGGRRYGEDLYDRWVLEEMGEDEWHFGLSDDNLLSEGFFGVLRREVDGGADAVVFPMRTGTGSVLRSESGSMSPGSVDGGQVAVRRGLVGELRWGQHGGDACVDGKFLHELFERTRGTAEWRFVQEPVLTHNALRR